MKKLYEQYNQSKEGFNLSLSLVKDLAEILYDDDGLSYDDFVELYNKASSLIESAEFNKLESDCISEIRFDALIFNEENADELIPDIDEKAFLNYISEDEVLEIYEKYCTDNQYWDQVFYPVHAIEDHFGPQVQDFILNNMATDDYYTLNDDGKISGWYDIKSAVLMAKYDLKNNFNYVVEYYKR